MKLKTHSLKIRLSLTLLVVVILVSGGFLSCTFIGKIGQSGSTGDRNSKWEIINPYEGINWTKYGQYKANFHTHTTVSDGRFNPHQVVDLYKNHGYDILAITDHNAVTYPWQGFSEMTPSTGSVNRMSERPEIMPENFDYENRDPVLLQMIDIQGNELSRHHHIGSFFTDHDGTETERESLDATKAKNGIAMLYHPGRYFDDRNPGYYRVQWYVDLYQEYDHLFGLEVYNQGERYKRDRMMWDSILTVMMPERPVWGYANDDFHSINHLGLSWNMMILSELNHGKVREAMVNGHSYFIHAPEGHDGPTAPVIISVHVDQNAGTIEIVGDRYESVKWISEGKIVGESNKINLNNIENPGVYIRAKLWGEGGTVAGTQPFGIRKN